MHRPLSDGNTNMEWEWLQLPCRCHRPPQEGAAERHGIINYVGMATDASGFGLRESLLQLPI